jgi:hypothetical protein
VRTRSRKGLTRKKIPLPQVSAPAKKPGLILGDRKWENDRVIDKIRLSGVAINNTQETYKTIIIYITARDATGSFIGYGEGLVEPSPIASGASSGFTAYIDGLNQTSTLKIEYRFKTR